MRQLLRFAVKKADPGIRCLEANDGEEALAHLAREPIRLILTDLNMPLMDGLTLLTRIRARPEWNHIPVVIITTESEREDRDKALTMGATGYLTKPVQAPAVVGVIRKELDLP